MNYQGSTCICRVPKAQVRTGTVVECVHCGRPIPSLSFPSIDIIAKVVGAAVPIPDVFREIPVVTSLVILHGDEDGVGQAEVPMTYPNLLFMHHPAQLIVRLIPLVLHTLIYAFQS